MSKLVVIGKSSALYQSLRLHEQAPSEMLELSTSEFMEYEPQADDFFLVFSLLSKAELKRKFSGAEYARVIIVGSVSAISAVAPRFKYSRLKLSQLQYCKEHRKSTYIAFGVFDLTKPLRGLNAVSNSGDFWQSVMEVMTESHTYVECYSLIDTSDRWSISLSHVERVFSPVSSLALKFCGGRVYGYNDARLYKRE